MILVKLVLILKPEAMYFNLGFLLLIVLMKWHILPGTKLTFSKVIYDLDLICYAIFNWGKINQPMNNKIECISIDKFNV